MNEIIIEQSPAFCPQDFINTKIGLSGFMRVKNEGEYVYEAISSWLCLVDEIVVVFNDCSDNSESEIQRAINDFPQKIKAYKYVPKVYPPNSKEYLSLSPNHPQSLVHYYNFALSKTTYDLVVKIDGDLIFDKKFVDPIKRDLHKCRESRGFIGLRGVNLVDNNAKLYIPTVCGWSKYSYCGGFDLCIFPINPKNIFHFDECFELLILDDLVMIDVYYCYYHTKFIKKDMGISVYDLSNNAESRYVGICRDFLREFDFTDVDVFLKRENLALSPPQELGLSAKYDRDFRECYKRELVALGINCNFVRVPCFLRGFLFGGGVNLALRVLKFAKNLTKRALRSLVKKIKGSRK